MEAKFDIGDLLQEKVTKFEGIVMAVTLYATGCIHYGLQSREMKDGKPSEWEWFDEKRLKLSKQQAVKFEVSVKKPSGAFPNPPEM